MIKTRTVLLAIAATLLLPTVVLAQDAPSLYQSAPDDWRSEVIPFPLTFAPDIPLQGVEELRFAPGMMKADTEDYFTYTFLWWLNGRPGLTPQDLEKHLLAYFTGLYKAVIEGGGTEFRGFEVDILGPDSEVEGAEVGSDLHGVVKWVDPFVTKEPLVLNIKIWQWYCYIEDRTAIFFALSPQPSTHALWQEMGKQKAGECQEGK